MSALVPSQLPRPFTSLVGRAQDIARISELLLSPTGSIVTLVGPAGVGKTRLAIAVAEAVEERFADGVVYVDLTSETDPRQVVSTIVSAVGISDGEGAAGRLTRYLADRSLLLVIDNFEQVRAAAPRLNACLASAAHVRTLVTSQAPLRVQGEREYIVEPLSVPNVAGASESCGALEAIQRSPAVELFVRRAQMQRPSFVLTHGNAKAVVEICKQLDGLPLAIELAAARSNVLPPEALLNRLTAPLQLLSGGPRDALDRHQALHSALAWSYGLLSADEALLFERLSVFTGAFSLSAAEGVCGNDPIVFAPSFYAEQVTVPQLDPPLASNSIFDLLDALVDHHLVQRVEPASDEPRFRLFTTIRQFAAEKLRLRGCEDEILLRHATWFRAQAERVWTAAGTPVLESEWLGPLENDIDNFRSALLHLSEIDPATASTFAGALGWHFYFFGRRNEGLRAFERVACRFDPAVLSPVNRARNHYMQGILLAHCPGREQEGAAHFEAMLAEVEGLGIDWAVGFALLSLGVTAEDAGEYERALEQLQRARLLLQDVEDVASPVNVDFHIASVLFGLGRISEARTMAESIVALPPSASGVNLIYALHLLGIIRMVEGDLAGAAKTVRQFIDTAFRYQMGNVATEATDATATIAVRAGQMELGAQLFGTADRVNLDADYAIQYPERPIYEAARAAARDALGPDRFDELYRAGSQVGLAAAVVTLRAVLDAFSAGHTPPAAAEQVASATQAPALTRREIEVLQLVTLGLTDREIGDRLFISHKTARTHVSNILEKLQVPSRSAATSLALRAGIVRLEEARE